VSKGFQIFFDSEVHDKKDLHSKKGSMCLRLYLYVCDKNDLCVCIYVSEVHDISQKGSTGFYIRTRDPCVFVCICICVIKMICASVSVSVSV